ncbi:MAG: response regulator [Lachnospiraceae bacterium]|nr:response regulator [Lachnospiraceae bacterium]
MNDNTKENRKSSMFIFGRILIYATMMIFFICVIMIYYRMIYDETKENIINTGRCHAIETADVIDKKLSSYIDILRLASYSLDNMIRDERSNGEILDYLVNETVAFKESLSSESTGLYGYINDEYMDGSGWVPDDDYVASERPWYAQSKAGSGRIVLGDPYLDLDTGTYTITIGKVLCDAQSVIAIDLLLSQLQMITDDPDNSSGIYSEIIINAHGEIMTHSDPERIGTYLSSSDDPLEIAISKRLNRENESFFYLKSGGKDYMVYVMPLQFKWASITVIDATEDIGRLIIPLSITIFMVVVIVFVVAISMFISDKRRRISRDLEIETERATAASDAKSEFLSNMSHEIRTPINAILGMNEMVLRVSDDSEVQEYSENIKNAGKTLLGIVNDILDFSKIEAGKMEIIPEEYELASMLNDLVTMIDIRVESKGLVLKLDFDKDTPEALYGDEGRIKQIITNLLTNAVKYTQKGSVTFKVGYEKIADEEDYILLNVFVEDTGSGIKKEDMDKLFLKFERIDEDRNRNIEGTGLGMSITMNLLKMMGSNLVVDSVYGKGSSFGFQLKQRVVRWEPLGDYVATYRDNIAKKTHYQEKFTAPEARVLVVDDNKMNLVVFSSLLKQTEVKIDTAESGDEGIRLSGQKKYDLIFLDHMMPGKDGIVTLREIRRDESNPNVATPVVCLTANAISGAKDKYIEAGFNEYLSKPIDTVKLEQMMVDYLPADKVILKTVEAADNAKSGGQIPEDLKKLVEAGVDVKTGLGNSGDEKSYRSLLKIFYESIDEQYGQINGFYEAKDYKNYTIKVHGLKSTARIIGATDFGERAQKLEDAGKKEDVAYINEHHKDFMEKYRSFAPYLEEIFGGSGSDADKPLADEAIISEMYQMVKSAAESMDCDQLEYIFAELDDYRIPDKDKAVYERLREASDKYEYDKILEILNKEIDV